MLNLWSWNSMHVTTILHLFCLIRVVRRVATVSGWADRPTHKSSPSPYSEPKESKSCRRIGFQMSYLHSQTTSLSQSVRVLVARRDPRFAKIWRNMHRWIALAFSCFCSREVHRRYEWITLVSVEIWDSMVHSLVHAVSSNTEKNARGDHRIMHLVPLSFLGFPIGRGFKTALVTFST